MDLITVTIPVEFSKFETSFESIFENCTTTTTTMATDTTETITTTHSTAFEKIMSSTTTNGTKQTVTNETASRSEYLTCLGIFKGTYYAGKTVPCKGGSGRTLINCSTSSSEIKGSVASRYIYNMYGYNRGGRTKVWIECSEMPSMTGWYYVDDCCGATNVIDFYYYKNANCPFRKSGVIFVKAYI